MPAHLSTAAPEFENRFTALMAARADSDASADAVAAEIIADVRARGDSALIEYTERFDRVRLTPDRLRVSEAEIDAAMAAVSETDRRALELAARRIAAYHQRQLPEDARWTDEDGVELGWRWTAVDAAGLYAPGGLASYPSSVLMNAAPAQTAGVARRALCAPAPDGEISPLTLVAARIAGIDEIYRIGGAQAIAAMAYGTDSVAPVDVITGPGNAYVAAAKRRVFGHVGLDSIAGPSEVLIIADAENDPDWLALDLMAQAEHDASAQSILITDSAALAEAALGAVERLLQRLSRAEIAGESWRRHGAVIVVRDLSEAADLANRIAPEHLQICATDAEAVADRVRHAGAMFLGRMTPEALGDYVAGPNHVLPTSQSARHASGLNVLDFMKRTTITRADAGALARLGPAAAALADAEGLEAHALSVRARLAPGGGDD